MLEQQILQEEIVQDKITGKVKWFDATKGIGFLQCENYPFDIFIHYENIIGKGFKVLKARNKVKFSLYKTEKGYCAKNVTIIN